MRILYTLLLILGVTPCLAQVNIKTVQSDFEKGLFEKVISTLEPALQKSDKDARQNYYLGAAYVMTNQKTSEAIRRLKYAQLKGVVLEGHYYIGRAYQNDYEYELARQSFEKYLKTTKTHKFEEECNKAIEQCNICIPLASKVFRVRVIDKYRVTPDSLLAVYNPSREVGQVVKNSAFFESNIDPDGILFRTERGDAVYFSMTSGDSDNPSESLYKMERLLDGWGDATLLSGLQTTRDDGVPVVDKTPVMMTDGITLYFASNRPGGMGGMDIYRTTYDADNRSFTEPVNLGVPFNSPADDYLFVADEFRERAWVASTRETHGDSVMVYEILWDNTVIRSFAQSTEEIKTAAALNIDEALAGLRDHNPAMPVTNIASREVSESQSAHSVANEKPKFSFVVCDSLTYTQWEHFRSDEARAEYEKSFQMQSQRDSLMKVMSAGRKEFLTLKTNEERNAKIAEILRVERSIYSIEDELAVQGDKVRNLEMSHIQSLITSGQYVPLNAIRIQEKVFSPDWDDLLVEDDYLMMDKLYFVDVRTQRASTYSPLFTKPEMSELQEADSLVAWAGLMQMEVVKIEELLLKGEKLKYRGELLSYEETKERLSLLRKASLVLNNRSLDSKFEIFDDRYEMLVSNINSNVDLSEVADLRNSAIRDFSLVESITISDGEDQFSKAGLMKKRGIKSYEQALQRLVNHIDGTFPLPEKQSSAGVLNMELAEEASKTQVYDRKESTGDQQSESESDILEQQTKADKSVTEVVEESPNKPDEKTSTEESVEKYKTNVEQPSSIGESVFKIQLGVFRGNPDPAKLSKVGKISTEPIPDKGLTKYFAGSFATREEANAQLDFIHKIGFQGAFVVEMKQ